MPRDTRTITPTDILPLDQYELIRADKKAEAIERKKLTRLAVGPYATASELEVAKRSLADNGIKAIALKETGP